LCGRCASAPPPLDACFAAVDYLFPWSGLITHFKFHSQPGLAGPLARLVLALPGLQQTLNGADRVLPMPLAAPRLAERGYNQALLLARQLAPGQVDARLLLRVQDTPPQNQLDRQLRQHNVRHAFALDPLRAGLAAGRHLVLVDDVMTTGASLYSAAMALRQAGAARVSAVVVARTPEYTGEHVPHRPV
jgi:ComF family protein